MNYQNLTLNELKKIIKDKNELSHFLSSVSSYYEIKNEFNTKTNSIKLNFLNNKKETNINDEKITYKKNKVDYKNLILNLKKLFKELLESDVEKKQLNEKEIKYVKNLIFEILKWRTGKTHKFFKNDIEEYKNLKSKPILYVRNLTKYYPFKKIPTINKLNFSVFPGEFHAFIGANGAGKTTTIKSLITSYQNWSGTILVDGKPNISESAKKKIGYIPEKANFPERISTLSYLKWMVTLSGINPKDAKEIAKEKLKELGMWNLRHRSPNTFSSGQKKKILLAQALIHNPDIIIMDEPVANLDPKSRINFFDTLLKLKNKNKSIFISSHVLAELDIYADSLTILDGGKIIYSGKKDKLLKKFDNNEYLIKIDPKDSQKFLKLVNVKNVEIINVSIEKGEFLLKTNDQKLIKNIQKIMVDNKIFINSFNKNLPSLENIYKNLIIYGSVDTLNEVKK